MASGMTAKQFDRIRKAEGQQAAVRRARELGLPTSQGGRKLRFPSGGSRLSVPPARLVFRVSRRSRLLRQQATAERVGQRTTHPDGLGHWLRSPESA